MLKKRLKHILVENQLTKMNSIELEILSYSQLEHFKMAKDLSTVLSIDHPKRILIDEEYNKITLKIQELKAKKK